MSRTEALGYIIKREREKRNLLLRHVAAALDIDQALVSKFEHGDRMPTKEQVVLLANYFHLNENDLMTAWLADKIYTEVQYEKMALRAVKLVEKKLTSK